MSAGPKPSFLTTSDRAFLNALRLWGEGFGEEVRRRLSPEWEARLLPEWEFLEECGQTADEARHSLLDDAHPQRRIDLGRVHPTWVVETLAEESPAVRRLIASMASGQLAEIVRAAFPADAIPLGRPPDPDAASAALTLWSHRLVGDRPRRDDDPPVVRLLTDRGPTDRYRTVLRAGLIKLLALDPARRPALPGRQMMQLRDLEGRKVGQGQGAAALVEGDLGSLESPADRIAERLGLITVGRLARSVEPYRRQWALQHIPYPIAHVIREASRGAQARNGAVIAWERRVLRAAMGGGV